MKKGILFCLVVTLVCLLGLVACDNSCSHTYSDWQITTAATCTEDGAQERTCSKCSNKESEAITATGHTYGDWQITTAATCTEDGAQEHTCSKCSNNESEVITATGHTYGDWQITTAATCTEDGAQERTCSKCSNNESEVITATGHTFNEEWAYDETNHWHAATCGHNVTKANGEHNWVNEACSICSIKRFTQGLALTFNDARTEYTVTGIGTAADTDIVIPSAYKGIPVTSIGYRAFWNCSSLTSLSIPNSVTSIGSYAFERCSGLTSLSIPNSVTSIGTNAFNGCNNLQFNEYDNALYLGNSDNPYFVLIYAKNTSITSCEINSQTKIIAGNAFLYCSSLTSLSIPNSVTSIGDSAFNNCSGLKTISIPDSVTSIGDSAFYNCTNLTSLSILNSVEYIGARAFRNCSGLTSLSIPNSVEYIGTDAFRNCSGLTSLSIPNSVTSIGEGAFNNCSGLETITVESGNLNYHSDGNCLIETATKTLILGCKNSIIPTNGSVTSIGYGAFYNCSGLTSLSILNSVEYIGTDAFRNCSGLTSLSIPNSVTSIGEGAFNNCSSLETITVESGNLNYHSDGNCLIETETKTLILGCKNSIIPTNGSVTSIGDSAFYGCSGLINISIPDSVTHIGIAAFLGCSSLVNISIPDTLIYIGGSVFNGCNNLQFEGDDVYHYLGNNTNPYLVLFETTDLFIRTATINSQTKIIAAQAFYGKPFLASVTIPNSVTFIGESAFDICNQLSEITYDGTTTEWQAISKESSWDDATGDYTVTCTDGTVSKNGTVTPA